MEWITAVIISLDERESRDGYVLTVSKGKRNSFEGHRRRMQQKLSSFRLGVEAWRRRRGPVATFPRHSGTFSSTERIFIIPLPFPFLQQSTQHEQVRFCPSKLDGVSRLREERGSILFSSLPLSLPLTLSLFFCCRTKPTPNPRKQEHFRREHVYGRL